MAVDHDRMKAHRGKPPTDGLRHVNGRGAIVGRERADNVSDCTASDTKVALHELLTKTLATGHPYGDGHASERIATVLATADFKVHAIAKRNAY